MFYATLKTKYIDGVKCYISQPFRLYRQENEKLKSNLSFIRASLEKYNLNPTPRGVYIIYSKKKIVYIGHSEGDKISSNVLKTCQRHFHDYNDSSSRRRIFFDKYQKYVVQFIFPQTDRESFSYSLEKSLIAAYQPKENTFLYLADEKYSDSQLKEFLQGLKVETSNEVKGLIKEIKKNPKNYDNVEIEEYKQYMQATDEDTLSGNIEDVPF